MSEPEPDLPERLLDHVPWVRNLARHLVSDPHAADDLAQEACVAALEHQPPGSLDARRWLGGVLRNLARERSRSSLRRVDRERAAARPEHLEATDELVARAQMQRELVVAVLELDEPYRSAVLLRWFEGLAPAAIAARLALPVATVHSRQQRALALLRTRLDRAYGGDRRAWSAAVFPLCESFPLPQGAPTLAAPLAASVHAPSLGALLMNAKLIATLVLTLGVTALLVWNYAGESVSGSAESKPVLAVAPDAARPLSRDAAPSAPAGEQAEQREPAVALEPAAVPASASAPAPAERWTVRGRVLDAEARPRSGLALKFSDSGEPLESAADGRFEFETSAERGSVACADPRWVTVRNGLWSRGSQLEPLLIAAPAIDVSGSVVDSQGRLLQNARIVLAMPSDFAARFAQILEATQPLSWSAASGARGEFTLTRVPAIPGAQLRAVLEGFAPSSIEAPLTPVRGLEIVLQRPSVPLAGSVRGRVADLSNRPIEGARVALGLASTSTDAEGLFAIDLARAVTSERLLAVCAGMQPTLMERPREPAPGITGWPDSVELRMGAPALSIAGRVVDASGEAVSGAKLWIGDPTPFGAVGAMPAMMENLIAGAAVPPQAFDSEPAEQDADDFRDWVMPAGAPSALWNWVATDADGRFEIGGLCDRSYRLKLMLDAPLCITESRSIPAGTRDALIRMDAIELIPSLKGQVLSDRGEPVAGVRVQSHLTVSDVKGRVFGGTNQIVLIQRGPAARSDSEGKFELVNLPRQGTKLTLNAEGIVPTQVELSPTQDPESFEVVVHQRCHFQVELLPPADRADEFRVIDGEGRQLDLLVITGGSVNAYTSMALNEGRSEVVSISSEARTLVLLKNELEVGRFALDLLPGEVNRVRR